MASLAAQQYRMIHNIYVLLDDGDRRGLRAFDLSPSQYTVLLQLDSTQAWRLTDLSDQLLFDKSTITRIIDRLEQALLVQRIADPSDRRVQRVVLTAQGVELRAQAQAAYDELLEQRLSVLDLQEQEQLSGLLDKLRARLQEDLLRDPL